MVALLAFVSTAVAEPVSIFDGKTFTGWEGDTATTCRIEEDALTGGSLTESFEMLRDVVHAWLCAFRS